MLDSVYETEKFTAYALGSFLYSKNFPRSVDNAKLTSSDAMQTNNALGCPTVQQTAKWALRKGYYGIYGSTGLEKE